MARSIMARWTVALGALLAAAPALAETVVPTGAAPDPSGRWRGEWLDQRSGHRGPLRATLRPADDGAYRAVFAGRYFAVIPFRFAATLRPAGIDATGAATYAGTQRLGPFGAFQYSAVTDGTTLVAEYSSRRWAGRFSLRR